MGIRAKVVGAAACLLIDHAMRHRLALTCTLAMSVLACDDGGPARDVATSGPDTSESDVARDVSELPLGRWVFREVAGSVCANGTPTGVGVSRGTSDVVVVFMSPGSACFDARCAIGTPSMRKDGGFGAAELAACVAGDCDGGMTFPDASIFDRDAPANPFRDATYVYVSVCSGDYYIGDGTHAFDDWTATFHGHTNQRLFASALATWLPATERVVLTGGSAGAAGATLNYWQWVEVFAGTRVDLVSDSFTLVDADGPQFRYGLHAPQLPPGCEGCADDYRKLYDYNAALAPDARIAIIDSRDDLTLDLTSGYTYTAGLEALQPRIDGLANTRYFIANGAVHVLLKHPLDSSATDVDDAEAGEHDLGEFLRAMQSDDPAWSSWSCLGD